MQRIRAEITEIKQLAEGIWSLVFLAPEAATIAQPGQFVHIACGTGSDPLLRRPISICDADRTRGTIRIIFQVRGRGTAAMAAMSPGDTADVIAPLGRGFTLEDHEKIAVIGGGIGIYPLLFLLKESRARVKHAFLGFRECGCAVLTDEFEQVSTLHVATDDGSLGERCLVPDLLARSGEEDGCGRVYACGPAAMLRCTAELCLHKGIPLEVSLEQRMGCGVGACLVCACKTKHGEDSGYSHVCADGPVFDAREVAWEDFV